MYVINLDLSKAESQALTNYGSGEDENEDEEMEDFEESPVDIQTSLQANTETTEENEHDSQVVVTNISAIETRAFWKLLKCILFSHCYFQGLKNIY